MGKVATDKSSKSVHPKQNSQGRSGRQHEHDNKSAGPAKLAVPSIPTIYTVAPPNWPSSMPYLPTSHPSTSLTPNQLSHLHPATLSTSPQPLSAPKLATYTATSNPLVKIVTITTPPSHPAFNQHGLFAARLLSPGSFIVDYTGDLHSCPQIPSCSTSDYDLAFLDRDASLAIDGAKMGNEGRFVNDWHGIREDGPNAMFEEYYVRVKRKGSAGGEAWEARMGIWVLPSSNGGGGTGGKDTGKKKGRAGGGLGIAKGEEICVSYGRGWWRARRGVMEEWDEIVDEEQQANVSDETRDSRQ